jgi:hypothetical protein
MSDSQLFKKESTQSSWLAAAIIHKTRSSQNISSIVYIISEGICDPTRLVSILCLFNNSLSVTLVTVLIKNDTIMNNELESIWKRMVLASLELHSLGVFR